jgi:hypothetical protein
MIDSGKNIIISHPLMAGNSNTKPNPAGGLSPPSYRPIFNWYSAAG